MQVDNMAGIFQAVRLGGVMVVPLALLAIVALAIIFDRAFLFWRSGRLPRVLKDARESAQPAMHRLMLAQLPRHNVFRQLATPFAGDAAAPLWWMEAQTQELASRIEREMSRGLWVLETVVTAAPLLGLLGTIIGMMHSFQLIGASGGIVNPTGITGGVAQALIATAIGLVVAVVALFAFNYFTRRTDRLIDELESFANSLQSEIRLAREKSETMVHVSAAAAPSASA
jgi:biopolymer transport protein ExbB